jgi:3-oxoacyl-[acyl-carrier protein] reductase
MIDTGLAGKVVLVTGANHGIGAATARAFAAEGAAVLISYLRLDHGRGGAPLLAEVTPGRELYEARQEQSADAVVEEIRRAGGRAAALEADLADPASVPRLFDHAEAALGPVDVLVNNAAYCLPDTFMPSEGEMAPGGWRPDPITGGTHDRHFAVNSRAPALMMAELARRIIARGTGWGRIINVSTDGASGFATEVSYGASKHALESYSRAAAQELGRHGITVNVVSLGPIQTGWISPELEALVLPRIPLGRIGRPEDVADAVLFLASHQARWITGQLLYVGGGQVMHL